MWLCSSVCVCAICTIHLFQIHVLCAHTHIHAQSHSTWNTHQCLCNSPINKSMPSMDMCVHRHTQAHAHTHNKNNPPGPYTSLKYICAYIYTHSHTYNTINSTGPYKKFMPWICVNTHTHTHMRTYNNTKNSPNPWKSPCLSLSWGRAHQESPSRGSTPKCVCHDHTGPPLPIHTWPYTYIWIYTRTEKRMPRTHRSSTTYMYMAMDMYTNMYSRRNAYTPTIQVLH